MRPPPGPSSLTGGSSSAGPRFRPAATRFTHRGKQYEVMMLDWFSLRIVYESSWWNLPTTYETTRITYSARCRCYSKAPAWKCTRASQFYSMNLVRRHGVVFFLLQITLANHDESSIRSEITWTVALEIRSTTLFTLISSVDRMQGWIPPLAQSPKQLLPTLWILLPPCTSIVHVSFLSILERAVWTGFSSEFRCQYCLLDDIEHRCAQRRSHQSEIRSTLPSLVEMCQSIDETIEERSKARSLLREEHQETVLAGSPASALYWRGFYCHFCSEWNIQIQVRTVISFHLIVVSLFSRHFEEFFCTHAPLIENHFHKIMSAAEVNINDRNAIAAALLEVSIERRWRCETSSFFSPRNCSISKMICTRYTLGHVFSFLHGIC